MVTKETDGSLQDCYIGPLGELKLGVCIRLAFVSLVSIHRSGYHAERILLTVFADPRISQRGGQVDGVAASKNGKDGVRAVDSCIVSVFTGSVTSLILSSLAGLFI